MCKFLYKPRAIHWFPIFKFVSVSILLGSQMSYGVMGSWLIFLSILVQISFRPNVRFSMFFGHLSFRRYVLSVRCPSAICPFGQFSFSHISFRPFVFRPFVLPPYIYIYICFDICTTKWTKLWTFFSKMAFERQNGSLRWAFENSVEASSASGLLAVSSGLNAARPRYGRLYIYSVTRP